MFRLTQCCCCSLRTETILIGYLQIICSLVTIIFNIYTLITYRGPYANQLTISLSVIVVATGFGFWLSILMLYGAHENKTGYLIPWLIANILDLVLTTALVIFGYLYLIYLHFHQGLDVNNYFLILPILSMVLGITWYCCLVVYSFYKEQRDKEMASERDNLVHHIWY